MLSTSIRSLIIVGAGGHASEVAAYVGALAEQGVDVRLIGFVDEHRPLGPWNRSVVLGGFDALRDLVTSRPEDCFEYITAVGANQVRMRFVREIERLGSHNLRPGTVVHPLASIGPGAQVGAGTCLAPNSIVTTNATIGRHCILNVKASVSHDASVGDFSNLNPGATVCGNVRIGRGCYIGAGATIIDKIPIGDYTTIGAGAVVVRDVPAGVTAVGVPALVTRRSEPVEI